MYLKHLLCLAALIIIVTACKEKRLKAPNGRSGITVIGSVYKPSYMPVENAANCYYSFPDDVYFNLTDSGVVIMPYDFGKYEIILTDRNDAANKYTIKFIVPVDSAFIKHRREFNPKAIRMGEDERVMLSKEYDLIHKKVPAFTAKAIEGGVTTEKELIDKISVLNFWFFECYGCMQEIPDLNAVHDEWEHDAEVQMLSFFKDSAYVENGRPKFFSQSWINGKIRKGYKALEYDFRHHIMAKKLSDSAHFNFLGYPHTYIVDKAGTIRYVFPGYHEGIGESISNAIHILKNKR